MTKPIADLEPGTAFRLACNGRPGVLLAVNPGCATVRYAHEAPKDDFHPGAPSGPTTISLSTEVEV